MFEVEVCRWVELGDARRALLADINHIFFSSSARQTFESENARDDFRERWLGRYLRHHPDNTFVALDGARRVAGYVIGSLDDPARDPLFADLPFMKDFAGLTARFPAQLHVNVEAGRRGQGIGARLVEAFARHAAAAGAAGMHVVTARGMRNVGFYEANGFREQGALAIGGRELVFLGCELGPGASR